jgi:hypothetical protein
MDNEEIVEFQSPFAPSLFEFQSPFAPSLFDPRRIV